MVSPVDAFKVHEHGGGGGKLPFWAGRDSTATRQPAAGSSERPSARKGITQKNFDKAVHIWNTCADMNNNISYKCVDAEEEDRGDAKRMMRTAFSREMPFCGSGGMAAKYPHAHMPPATPDRPPLAHTHPGVHATQKHTTSYLPANAKTPHARCENARTIGRRVCWKEEEGMRREGWDVEGRATARSAVRIEALWGL
ncbi:hypothetical protein B0H10DRAFT_2436087 [Mycena sp. CBHHK59/15]|nr:hypothetical protein B0H10DRAFT_2436087 [Mycena sp. CBHHK59/15]